MIEMRALLLASLAITHVTLINPDATPRSDVTVVVRDGRIAEIGKAVPADAQIVDGRGKFLIPGLWDMHVHLSWVTSSALPLLIRKGFRTVATLGSGRPGPAMGQSAAGAASFLFPVCGTCMSI